ncbi:MAG: DUF4384 domain-containing protein [Desulfuromonadaceae bacterium]
MNMKLRICVKSLATLLVVTPLCVWAEDIGDSLYSKSLEAKGTACTGSSISWEQGKEKAQNEALERAKQDASSRTVTFVSSYNKNIDNVAVQNVKQSLSLGSVQTLAGPVYSDPVNVPERGFCTTATITAMVLVDKKLLTDLMAGPSFNADPTAPLNVRVWTDKKEYHHGEKIKITVMANKDFFLDLMYVDASNKKIKLLPNQFCIDNRFKGTQVHNIPLDSREFEIEVDCVEGKCGEELIIATASTHRILYDADTSGTPIAGTNIAEYKGDIRTRSVKIMAGVKQQGKKLLQSQNVASDDRESAQSSVVVFTRK